MEPLIVERRYAPKRSRTRPPFASILFYLSSLIPAVLAFWYFDILSDLKRAIQPRQEKVTVERSATPLPQVRPHPRPQRRAVPMSTPVDSRRDDTAVNEMEPGDEDLENDRRDVRSFPLDLSVKRQVLLLGDLDSNWLRIEGIQGCDVPFDIRPADGLLGDSDEVDIVLHGAREVVLSLARKKAADTKPALFIEAQVITSSGAKIPFTTSSMDRTRGQIEKALRGASRTLNDLQSEMQRINVWLVSPAGRLRQIR